MLADDTDYHAVLVEPGENVGRIFLSTGSSTTENWYWGVDDLKAKGRRPYCGHAESKEAATQAFAECSRRDLRLFETDERWEPRCE